MVEHSAGELASSFVCHEGNQSKTKRLLLLQDSWRCEHDKAFPI